MTDAVNETQECRIYARDEWTSLIEYVLYMKHQMPYYWAAEQAAGKRALDFGCGSGYGTAILAETAAEAIGVDASPRAVAMCAERFDRPNLRFVQIEPNYTLPFEDDSFDVITSCQVIEHMPEVRPYLEVLKRVLKPGGRLIITTCNRDFRLFPWQRPWQEAHFREYDLPMMDRELKPVFDSYEVKGIGASDAAHQVYVDHYRPTLKDALIRHPVRRWTQALLPAAAADGLAAAKRRLRGGGGPGTPLSDEILARFSVADFFVTEDPGRAIDVLAVATK